MTNIAKVCNHLYGCSILVSSPETIIWAAEKVALNHGEEVARQELTEVNAEREKQGKVPACVPYGHILFK